MIGALLAWTFGSIPTTMLSMNTDPLTTPPLEPDISSILLISGSMGALLGIILAMAQWLVLRKHVSNAWWWLPANSAAWLLGMPMVFAAVDLAQKVESLAHILLIFAGALTLTGTVVGSVHGIALTKLAIKEV
jgi:hypothetical protein